MKEDILGYFKHGPVKWILIEKTGNMLKGMNISPLGKVHTLHIHEKEVHELVLIKK